MRLALLSERGRVGKTSLARAWAEFLAAPLYELELGLPKLWPQEKETTEEVYWRLSRVDRRLCDLCEECIKNCQFGALLREGEVIKHRGYRCRGCGLCKEVCPQKAISLQKIKIAEIISGKNQAFPVYTARFLRGGTQEGVVWRRLFEKFPLGEKAVLKAPTGLNGESLQAVKEAEAFLLVTTLSRFQEEISLFVEMVQGIGLPGAVILNFSDVEEEVRSYAESQGLYWLGTIPSLEIKQPEQSLLAVYPPLKESFSGFLKAVEGGS